MSKPADSSDSVFAYCRNYVRVSVAMAMMLFLFSLPAFFLFLTFTPEWVGYGVLSFSVIVLLGAGKQLLPNTENDGEVEQKLDEFGEQATQSEVVLFVVGTYAVIAGGVTTVLLTSAAIAGTLGYSGYSLTAITLALLIPYADSLLANKTGKSISNLGMRIAYYGIVVIGLIGGLSTEPFRQTAEDGGLVY